MSVGQKIGTAVAATVLAAGLAACGSGDKDRDATGATEQAEDATAQVVDGSEVEEDSARAEESESYRPAENPSPVAPPEGAGRDGQGTREDRDFTRTRIAPPAPAGSTAPAGSMSVTMTFGEDPYMDALYDQCGGGDMEACDELYMLSEAGSEYEEFGATCGATQAPGYEYWCSESSAWVDYDDTDAYLDELYGWCAAGDMASCDELYTVSPPGSDYEFFAGSCGGQYSSISADWCVSADTVDDAYGTFGSDPYLDSLTQSCEAGDMNACDDLYVSAPADSDYEFYGGTCGWTYSEISPNWCGEASPNADTAFYGADGHLDQLWDLCAEGDMMACDTLYQESPLGSDYETFGGSCGGLHEDGYEYWCDTESSDGAEADPAGSFGEDPYFDELYRACDNGDMAACDTLYIESPMGSEYEAFAGSCGGLYEESYGYWCEASAGETDTQEAGTQEAENPEDVYDPIDPYLDPLYDACTNGDMAACDDLYRESPVDSEYEWWGGTCGGLYEDPEAQWCSQ